MVNIVCFWIHSYRFLIRGVTGKVGIMAWWAILGAVSFGAFERNVISGIFAQRFERRRNIIGNRKLIETMAAAVAFITQRLHGLVWDIL